MEVVRDRADNCIIICSIENVDPMGVHTGDSITVAPALTLTDKEYQIMRNASIAVLREIGVDTGGPNGQVAVSPTDRRMGGIDMNPRVSRSSALASKATGFPIAKGAAKPAVGYTLHEGMDEVHRLTHIDPWFLTQIKEIVDLEMQLDDQKLEDIDKEKLRELKRKGFSDRRLAYLFNTNEKEVRAKRHALNIRPVYKRVDT